MRPSGSRQDRDHDRGRLIARRLRRRRPAYRADPQEQTAPLRVFADGSTRGVVAAIADYTKATGQRFELTFGPAGLLLNRIRKEGGADVYVSANMEHPQRLFEESTVTRPVISARNDYA